MPDELIVQWLTDWLLIIHVCNEYAWWCACVCVCRGFDVSAAFKHNNVDTDRPCRCASASYRRRLQAALTPSRPLCTAVLVKSQPGGGGGGQNFVEEIIPRERLGTAWGVKTIAQDHFWQRGSAHSMRGSNHPEQVQPVAVIHLRCLKSLSARLRRQIFLPRCWVKKWFTRG